MVASIKKTAYEIKRDNQHSDKEKFLYFEDANTQ